jgi:hypothetical protein
LCLGRILILFVTPQAHPPSRGSALPARSDPRRGLQPAYPSPIPLPLPPFSSHALSHGLGEHPLVYLVYIEEEGDGLKGTSDHLYPSIPHHSSIPHPQYYTLNMLTSRALALTSHNAGSVAAEPLGLLRALGPLTEPLSGRKREEWKSARGTCEDGELRACLKDNHYFCLIKQLGADCPSGTVCNSHGCVPA